MSPKYTVRGQQAQSRLLAKRGAQSQVGTGRISLTLGQNDPRLHRTAQAAQATKSRFHPDFFITDKQGRLRPKE